MLILGVHEMLIAVEAFSDTEVFRRYFPRNPILPRRNLPGFLACLLVLAMLWSVNDRFLPEIAMLQKPFDTESNMYRINNAIMVRQWTTPEATVGVLGAGTIPYYTERHGIDFLGKTDPYIARLEPKLAGRVGGAEALYLPGHNKFDLEYSIKELRPTFVEDLEWGESVKEWGESEYAKVYYKGNYEVHYKSNYVYLLKGSTNVNWHDIKEYRKSE